MKNRTIRWAAILTIVAIQVAGVASRGDERVVVREGAWTKATAESHGSWRIVEEGGRLYVELDDAFATKKAPDLKLFLTPWSADELSAGNVTVRALRVGALTSASGAQRFALPEGTDLSRYRTLAIHCEKYSKLWSYGEL